MTTNQLTEAIQEFDVTTLNGYATYKRLDGYMDCYLAKFIHGTRICLKARHTLIMKENAKPKCSTGRDIMGTNKTLHTTKHVADIPLTHLIYGCEFETKGKRYRVTPSKPMDNLIKLINGSEPGDLPQVMLALNQNEHVWVWQLRTINQHEVITVDYGGAYWLNCCTRLSQSQQKRLQEHYTSICFPPEWPHT